MMSDIVGMREIIPNSSIKEKFYEFNINTGKTLLDTSQFTILFDSYFSMHVFNLSFTMSLSKKLIILFCPKYLRWSSKYFARCQIA